MKTISMMIRPEPRISSAVWRKTSVGYSRMLGMLRTASAAKRPISPMSSRRLLTLAADVDQPISAEPSSAPFGQRDVGQVFDVVALEPLLGCRTARWSPWSKIDMGSRSPT